MKHLAVIGTGYVGLVTGTMFASVGNRVICVDRDSRMVDALRAGQVTIHEPGLEAILQQAIQEGNLSFTTDAAEAVANSEASLIAVGTPSLPSGAYDYSYVYEAAREIGGALRKQAQHFVVIKSTVTPEIYSNVQRILADAGAAQMEVISNPEFLAEGTAVRDFRQPHRVVIGAISEEARGFMQALYRPFVKRQPDLLRFTDPKSAIVTKLAANSFLAARVALINEIARYCDVSGADIEQVRPGLAADPRIGHQFLFAGPGYGGSCFGKDIRALRESAAGLGLELDLVPAIESSNCAHKLYLPRAVEAHFGSVKDKTIAVWGLAFKAQTDDIRESPALDFIDYLTQRGAAIRAHDPQALGRARAALNGPVEFVENKYDALNDAQALAILTEWDTYKSPDYYELRERMSGNVLVDGRNVLDPDEVTEAGFLYVGMGRRKTREAAAS